MIIVATSSSSAEAAPPALPPLPVSDIMQYGPQRAVQRRISEAMQPFAPAERSRESNPRRIFGEMKTEMEEAERRSHALESELGEAVGFFRAREAWWVHNLQELQEYVGGERSRFEHLAQTAVT